MPLVHVTFRDSTKSAGSLENTACDVKTPIPAKRSAVDIDALVQECQQAIGTDRGRSGPSTIQIRSMVAQGFEWPTAEEAEKLRSDAANQKSRPADPPRITLPTEEQIAKADQTQLFQVVAMIRSSDVQELIAKVAEITSDSPVEPVRQRLLAIVRGEK